MKISCGGTVPDKTSQERRSAADESGSVRFFFLRTRQRQPIVHMPLAVQNGLLTKQFSIPLSFQKCSPDSIVPFVSICIVQRWQLSRNTFRWATPMHVDLASTAWYVSQSPDSTC